MKQTPQFNTMNIDNQRIASLALFKSIYESENCNVYTIIERFVVATVQRNNLDTFSIEVLREKLNDDFNIDIENAVLLTVCKADSLFKYQGRDSFETSPGLKSVDRSAFDEEIKYNNRRCEEFIEELYTFYKSRIGGNEPEPKMKILIRQYFLQYIIDKESLSDTNAYVLLINEFVISHDKDASFVSLMSSIREGLTIYEGINYSDFTDKRTWKKEITFYLDVHYLFSAFGLNSDYHKQSFFDFHNLVKVINDGVPVKYGGRPRILLKYFSDTREEINSFFNQAIRMIKGDDIKNASNQAMEKILSQCVTPSDVLDLKAHFFSEISNLGIEEADDIDLEKGKDFLFETQDIVDQADKYFPNEKAEEVKDLFQIADYINILRQGAKVTNLENCGHIFLTDKNFAIEVSKFLNRADKNFRPHVFHKMDWFTERMWYLCNRSLTGSKPVNFDLINKAKNVVSGICKNKVHDLFVQLKQKGEKPDVLVAMYHEYRKVPFTTDAINSENVSETISFCQGETLAMFEEKYASLQMRAAEAESYRARAEKSEKELEESQAEKQEIKDKLKYAEGIGFRKRMIPIVVTVVVIMILLFLILMYILM